MKVLQRDDEWNSRRSKGTKGEALILKITYKKYAWNNYFTFCAEITQSLSQFRDTAKLKVFKKRELEE